jgi:hypothetical protein
MLQVLMQGAAAKTAQAAAPPPPSPLPESSQLSPPLQPSPAGAQCSDQQLQLLVQAPTPWGLPAADIAPGGFIALWRHAACRLCRSTCRAAGPGSAETAAHTAQVGGGPSSSSQGGCSMRSSNGGGGGSHSCADGSGGGACRG